MLAPPQPLQAINATQPFLSAAGEPPLLPPNSPPALRCLVQHPNAPHERQPVPRLAPAPSRSKAVIQSPIHRAKDLSSPSIATPPMCQPNSHFGNILFSLHHHTFVVTSVRDKILAPQQAHMPSGRPFHAAGRTLPGITPSSEPKFLIALSRLEILATPTKQTTAPFLIDANQTFFETQKSPRPIVIRANDADPHGSRGARRRGPTRRTTAGHPSRPHHPVASLNAKAHPITEPCGLRSLGRASGRTISLPPSRPHQPAASLISNRHPTLVTPGPRSLITRQPFTLAPQPRLYRVPVLEFR